LGYEGFKGLIGAEGKEEHFMFVVHHYRYPRAAKSEECGMYFKGRAVQSLFFILLLVLGEDWVVKVYMGL